MEAGEFDNLTGKGQPIDLRENPFEDPDLRMAHRILRNAGFAPAWIEESKDIDAEYEQACTKLARAREIYRGAGVKSNQAAWERNVREFLDKTAELNQRIRIYNLRVPSDVFQRREFDASKVICEI
jgi:DnaJ homolog subfamily C member 28